MILVIIIIAGSMDTTTHVLPDLLIRIKVTHSLYISQFSCYYLSKGHLAFASPFIIRTIYIIRMHKVI